MKEKSTSQSTHSPVLVHLSEVEPEEVSYVWPGRIPRGKLTVIGGDPGLGKSYLTLDVTARDTTGREWPDSGQAPLGNVILLSAEDGVADTIRPRVDALGGDPSRVWVLQAIKEKNAERPFSLAKDLPILEQAIAETNALLVVIDPLSAYLGNTDTYKDSDVRALLAPLAALAERRGVAVVAVMHLAKDAQRQAIYRVSGSIGFIGAPRAVFTVAKDPEEDDRRLFVPIKFNLGPMPPALAFRIVEKGVQWEANPVDVDIETVLGGQSHRVPEAETAIDQAEEFLRELLQDGPVESEEVLTTAKENGISQTTLNRAKQRLGVRSKRVGGLAGKGVWAWSLPTEATDGGT